MRYAEVDALKGVAIIGVLFAHLSFEGRFDASTLNAVGVLQGLFGWCVIAFFFASGLLGKPVGRKDALVGFVRKRFVRLIIPCWVFSVSYRLLRCGLFLTGRFSWDSPIPESAADALGFFLLPEGPQFYFLVYLFCVAVLFELLDLTLPRFLAYWITALAMPLSYVLIDGPARGYGPEIALWPVYLFAYAAGRVFAYESVIRKTSHRLVFLFCPLLAAVWVTMSPVVLYVLVPVLLWIMFREAGPLATWVNTTRLGTHSSVIYVWHAPIVLPFVSILCVRIFGSGSVVIVPIVAITVLISLCAGWVADRYRIFSPWRF